MKSHTEKHKVKLNPCKYCGETEVEIIYNRFNNQEHCVAQCKCGAYVQKYCINTLLAPELEKTVIAIWNNGNISKPLWIWNDDLLRKVRYMNMSTRAIVGYKRTDGTIIGA